MAKCRYLVSLITQDNDYQREQAASAKAAAQEYGIEAEIVYAGNDAITQSTQLLKAIQADTTVRPQAVIVEPLGATPFPNRLYSGCRGNGLGGGQSRSRVHRAATSGPYDSSHFSQRRTLNE